MSVREILHKFIRSLLGNEQVTDKWIEENDGHIIDQALSELDKLRLTEGEIMNEVALLHQIPNKHIISPSDIAEAIIEAERRKREG